MDSGVLVTVVEKCFYDFSYLPAGANEKLILAPAINVIPYYYADFSVRVHNIRMGAGTTAVIHARGTNPSRLDPQSFLSGSAALTATLTGASAGDLLTAGSSASNIPPFLQIELVPTQDAATPTYISFEISVDLLLRVA